MTTQSVIPWVIKHTGTGGSYLLLYYLAKLHKLHKYIILVYLNQKIKMVYSNEVTENNCNIELKFDLLSNKYFFLIQLVF